MQQSPLLKWGGGSDGTESGGWGDECLHSQRPGEVTVGRRPVPGDGGHSWSTPPPESLWLIRVTEPTPSSHLTPPYHLSPYRT